VVTDRLLTTREVPAPKGLTGDSPTSLRAGELPGNRLGSNVLRFRASEIEEWLEGTRPERPLCVGPGGGVVFGVVGFGTRQRSPFMLRNCAGSAGALAPESPSPADSSR
jgi:hypothetical protein